MEANTSHIRLQQHPAECGSVCLGILLTWLGHDYSSSHLRTICGVGRDGATIAQLQRGAFKLGFTAHVSKKGINALKKITSPLIVHWNMNHFVILEYIKDDRVEINDPAVGHRSMPIEEFLAHYTGICIEITDPKTPEDQTNSKRKKPVSLFDYLVPNIIPMALKYAFIPGLSLLFLQFLYAGLFHAYYDYSIANNLGHWAGVIALTGMITISCRWFLSQVLNKTQNYQSHAVGYQLEKNRLDALSQRSVTFFESHYDGEISQHILTIKSVTSILTSSCFMLFESVPFIVISLLLILIINPPLFFIVFVPYSLSLLYRHSIKAKMKEQVIKTHQAEARYQNQLMQRLFDYQRFAAMGLKFELFSSLITSSSFKHATRFNTVKQRLTYDALVDSIDSLTHPLMLFCSAYLLVVGELSFGAYAFTYMLSLLVLPKIKQLQQKTDQYLDAKDGVEASEDYDDEKLSDIVNDETHMLNSLTDPSALFQLIEVGFGYNGVDCNLFAGVNLTIKPGQIICFNGDSGSGKTTLLDILSGQRSPIIGMSLYQGVDAYHGVDAGFVFADEAVTGTLATFLFGQRPIMQAQMSAMITLVELEHRLGFNADSGGHEPIKPEELSVGEAQRLSLARALCFNPKIIFFDEAFSHIDLAQTRRIIKRLTLAGTTLIMATQRSEVQALAEHVYEV